MPVDPSTISGLVGWWKADAITGLSNNDPVVTWPDSSGNSHDATGVDDPIYETNAINGLPTVSIESVSRLTVADHADLKMHLDSTLFAVLKPNGSDPTGQSVAIPFSKGPDSGGGAYYLRNGGGFPQLDRPFVEAGVAGTTRWLAANYQAITCRVSGTDVSHFIGYTAVGTDTLATGTSTTDAGIIGAFRTSGAGGAEQGDFRIAELLIYNEALSTEDREAVTEYLQTKYALTPTSPPRSGRVYQVYGEIPGTDRTGLVYQVYGVIPAEARSGRVYQVYGQIPSFNLAGRVFQVFGRIPSPPSGTGGPGGGDEGEEVVTDFSRLLSPIHSTAYERPRGKQSWGQTGKVQARAGFSAGMRWTETYEPRKMDDPDFWAFVEYMNELQQNERLFEIALPDIMGRPTLLGTATGTALVNGADQVGFSLAADGWSGVLKRGDLIRVDGLNYTMVVTADVTATNAIPISPGILSGGSPENDAEIFYGSDLTVRAKIDGIQLPEVDGDHVYMGLRVTFREAP